jgi:hypothetical protein
VYNQNAYAGFSGPVHSFEFNGNFDDSLSNLVLENPFGGTVTSTTYVFDEGEGLKLNNPSVSNDVHSIEMCLKVDDNSDWRKLVDYHNLVDDEGLYINPDDRIDFYDAEFESDKVILDDTFFHVVVTSGGGQQGVRDVTVFVDGVKEYSFADIYRDAKISESDILWFVIDDTDTTGEDTMGTLNYINIYNYALGQSQVTELAGECSVELTPEPETGLYGSDSDNNIFSVNHMTGQATLIGTFEYGYSDYSTEIECKPNTVGPECYAQARNGGFTIHQFDLATGTFVGNEIYDGASFNGLEYVDGALYGTSITGPRGPSSLSTLNPDIGTSQLIGLTGVGPISGLAYDTSGGVMYGVAGGQGGGGEGPNDLGIQTHHLECNSSSFYTINLQTGQATAIGCTGEKLGSLQFGPDGKLYAGGDGSDGGNLYQIDKSTGSATEVGWTGFDSVTGLTLVGDITSPPEPETDEVLSINCDIPEGTETEISVEGNNIGFSAVGTCKVTSEESMVEFDANIVVDKNAPGLSDGVPVSEVDLNSWTEETYSGGNWQVEDNGFTVLQTVNTPHGTFFYSPFEAFDTQFTGQIKVETSGDDDYVGFALGFQPGATTDPNTEYLLVDWKQGNQNAFGAFAPAGLAVSKVNGIPTTTDLWGHQGTLTELARGINLGSTGWADHTTYEFTFVFTENNLKVFVNGVLEIDVDGEFSNGRLGFYNFSQERVRYSGFNVAPILDETGTVTIETLDGSGTITICEEGGITVNPEGPSYTINGASTCTEGTGAFVDVSCEVGEQTFTAIDNNDSVTGSVTSTECSGELLPFNPPKKKNGGAITNGTQDQHLVSVMKTEQTR